MTNEILVDCDDLIVKDNGDIIVIEPKTRSISIRYDNTGCCPVITKIFIRKEDK